MPFSDIQMGETPAEHRAEMRPPLDHGVAALIFAALGVVFGDIGTSPLYTLKTVISLSGGNPTHEDLIGLLSLVIWTLLITTSLKYVTFVMRVDNHGEGGILALMSLLGMRKDRHRPLIVMLGLFGAALIYGDGAITPAISVLSAIEGLKIAMPQLAPYILPISVFVLAMLFAFQYQGTSRIGWVFGPIMALWFLVIGGMGLWGVIQHPYVLKALYPYHASHYLFTHGKTGFLVLGGVFLAVTGAEALYADMGHIGARPIRLAWYGLVLPSLLLNYAGQTGFVLAGGSMEDNIFYRLCPEQFLIPFIGLATLATIIASQAIITGAFSMTRQAIQLGWCPRLRITQTSAGGYGQIYVSVVNWLLMLVTVTLTVSFGNSDSLAAAYGIAVSMTMLLTTALLFVAMREIWRWNLVLSLAVAGTFFCIDSAFFAANFMKVLEGGWVPLLLASVIYALMAIWHKGSMAVLKVIKEKTIPISEFMASLAANKVARVPGTAVFMTKTTEETPPILLWHVSRNRCLYEQVVAIAVLSEQVPWVRGRRRIMTERLAPDFWRIVARYGFMERPNIPLLLLHVRKMLPDINLDDVTYYIGHGTIVPRTNGEPGMPFWQQAIYAFMQRNCAQITDYFRMPRSAVVEIGRQIEV
jgi:KUP system potassium uptake protein